VSQSFFFEVSSKESHKESHRGSISVAIYRLWYSPSSLLIDRELSWCVTNSRKTHQ
jgi:hypothetical protein